MMEMQYFDAVIAREIKTKITRQVSIERIDGLPPARLFTLQFRHMKHDM
jgi:hypothetical protein